MVRVSPKKKKRNQVKCSKQHFGKCESSTKPLKVGRLPKKIQKQDEELHMAAHFCSCLCEMNRPVRFS